MADYDIQKVVNGAVLVACRTECPVDSGIAAIAAVLVYRATNDAYLRDELRRVVDGEAHEASVPSDEEFTGAIP